MRTILIRPALPQERAEFRRRWLEDWLTPHERNVIAVWLAGIAIALALLALVGCGPGAGNPKHVYACGAASRLIPELAAKVNGGVKPDAVTIHGWVFVFANGDDKCLLAHEDTHARDEAYMGAWFDVSYVSEYAKLGYGGVTWEMRANVVQDECYARGGQ